MSSRASSNSRNDSSSENEESEQESDEVIQERNRQLLEKYLKSQLELDVMDVDESEQTTEIDVVKVPAVVEEEEEVLRKLKFTINRLSFIYFFSNHFLKLSVYSVQLYRMLS